MIENVYFWLHMQNVILVALGGAIGASLRYVLSIAINNSTNFGFNAGTLSVNLIGSLVIGLIMGWLSLQTNTTPKLYFLLVVGLLGGFTTFSSFSYDNFQMLTDGLYKPFILYFLISNIGGILLAVLGYKLIANNFNIG